MIVGGAAVSFYTHGEILSGDFDLLADIDVIPFLIAEGFVREHRRGRLLRGFYHPDVDKFGFELVSGSLFDGKADAGRVLALRLTDDAAVAFPAVEDLIADRLGQFAASNSLDRQMLEQAKLLKDLALSIDDAYLRRRVIEETGDPSAIGL